MEPDCGATAASARCTSEETSAVRPCHQETLFDRNKGHDVVTVDLEEGVEGH